MNQPMNQPMTEPTAGSFPSRPLFAAAGLVIASLLAVSLVRVTGVGASREPEAAAISTLNLRFEDRPDGSITVFDTTQNRLVDTVAPGSNGFLRGTLRGLGRERKREGVSADKPFVLSSRVDGHLMLDDPSTGRRVDLGSFGPTNAEVFARLLTHAATPS